jgi:hypothetical protein
MIILVEDDHGCGPPKTDEGAKVGQHNAKPPKLGEKMHHHTHTALTFCKHFITELSAGFGAIIIFEAYRSNWLGLLGHDNSDTSHAIVVFFVNTPF